MYLIIGARTQVSVQVRLQFIQEDEQFSFIKLSVRLQIRWIDDHRARDLHFVNEVVHQGINRIVEAQILPGYSDARAPQAVGIEKLRIVLLHFRTRTSRCDVTRIWPSQSAEQNGCIPHRSRHRPSGILAMRDWNDSSTADQTQRRFYAHESIR